MSRELPKIEGMTFDELTALNTPEAKVLRHRLIRRSFETWCRYKIGQRGLVPAKHHLLIIDTIQALIHNELDKRRVMLLMPPGSAKSTYTSVLLPAWFINPEQYPSDKMLGCSHSFDLINGFSREAKSMVETEGRVLGVEPSKDSWASHNWKTTIGGEYFCAGVGAGLAGRRGKLGLIDDYMGSEEEANSPTQRDKIWKWYWADFLPRLLPDAWQFLIANRRHEEDLVGMLLNTCPNDWLVIKLPMLAEENDPLGRKPGERLWAEYFTQKQVDDAKQVSSLWAGLYQQRPAPEEGDFFKKDWLWEYNENELPTELRIYGGADYAVRKDEDSDSQCFLLGGVDDKGVLWILPNWYWERANTDVAVERMLDLVAAKQPISWFAGRENITGSIGPFLTLRMRERNVYVTIEELSESRDKQQKAQSIRARMAAKMVRFPKFAPGWDLAKHEILSFPNGKHDDFVDALSKLGQGLGQMTPAARPKPQWNGVVEQPRITLNWIENSCRWRDKRRKLALRDD